MKQFAISLLFSLLIGASANAQSGAPIFPYTQNQQTGVVTFVVPVNIPQLNGSVSTFTNITGTGNINWNSAVSGSGLLPANFIFSVVDTVTAGSNFYIPYLIQDTMIAPGIGHRQAIQIIETTGSGTTGKFYVGASEKSYLSGTSSGSAQGNNPYVQVDSTISAGTETVGEEVDTDIRATSNIVRKVGVQIVSVSTDAGHGSSIDAGVLFGAQSGAVGYKTLLQLGTSVGGAVAPVTTTGTLLDTMTMTANFGIHLDNMTCTTFCYSSPGFAVDGLGNIGAKVITLTNAANTVGAGQVQFGSTTAAVTNCGGAATACLVINVAGTQRYVPYY